MRALFARLVFGVLFFAVGCGGGEEQTIPSPTPDTFDISALNALVLQPSEVPALLRGDAFFGSGGTDVSYTAYYGDPSYLIVSAITRNPDVVHREDDFLGLRVSLEGLIGNERNFALPDSELAFAYTDLVNQEPSAAVIALRDEFILKLTISSTNVDQTSRVFDEATMNAYVTPILERIVQAVENPSSVTPVPDAPTYTPPGGGG